MTAGRSRRTGRPTTRPGDRTTTANGRLRRHAGWGGPNPPDREHTYEFRLYAVSETVPLDPEATKDDLEDRLAGDVLDSDTLKGTYTP